MQKVLTSEEMRNVDLATTEKYGIPSVLLMENAAHAAARVICEKLGGSVADKSVLIMCGRGNNGGDGAALARILWSQGADVEVCLFGQVENTAGDAGTNFEALQKISDDEGFEVEQTDLAFEEISSLEEWLDYDSLNFQGDDPDVIVDALFGTGLTRPLEGVFAEAAAFISAFCSRCEDGETLVVALDLPSGLLADCSDCTGSVAKADVTVTFTAPKLANIMTPAANCGGELVVAKIGSPCGLVSETPSQVFVSEADDVREWLSRAAYASNSYKNKRGHALLVAGSAKYSGAAVLCGNAAIRSGVGLVTIATPQSSVPLVASRVVPEVMVRGIAETANGAVSKAACGDIAEFWANVDCVAIGSGLSSSEEDTKELVRELVRSRTTPVVIDADGLTSLAPFDISGSDEHPLVLTPHDGEFLRLLGTDDRERIRDRIDAARKFAMKHNVFLVLKGERSLVAEPGGRVVVSPTGNSGLGKAGNGDTLCGVIAGFVAQATQLKLGVFETLVAAVYFAGLAGDIAEHKYGKHAMTASDVRDAFADVFELMS